jgi:hypothetical protein
MNNDMSNSSLEDLPIDSLANMSIGSPEREQRSITPPGAPGRSINLPRVPIRIKGKAKRRLSFNDDVHQK